MRIEFRRTGGFSPITDATGVVELKDGSAQVTAEPQGYTRILPADEAATLQSLIDPQRLAVEAAGTNNDATRDGFSYELSIQPQDGPLQHFSSDALSKPLLQWVQKESQRILAHKASA